MNNYFQNSRIIPSLNHKLCKIGIFDKFVIFGEKFEFMKKIDFLKKCQFSKKIKIFSYHTDQPFRPIFEFGHAYGRKYQTALTSIFVHRIIVLTRSWERIFLKKDVFLCQKSEKWGKNEDFCQMRYEDSWTRLWAQIVWGVCGVNLNQSMN